MLSATLEPFGRRQPSIESRYRNAEVFRHISREGTAGEQPVRRFDFAVGHPALASADPTQLACRGEAGAGSLDYELALHLRKTRHNVEEKAQCRRNGNWPAPSFIDT